MNFHSGMLKNILFTKKNTKANTQLKVTEFAYPVDMTTLRSIEKTDFLKPREREDTGKHANQVSKTISDDQMQPNDNSRLYSVSYRLKPSSFPKITKIPIENPFNAKICIERSEQRARNQREVKILFETQKRLMEDTNHPKLLSSTTETFPNNELLHVSQNASLEMHSYTGRHQAKHFTVSKTPISKPDSSSNILVINDTSAPSFSKGISDETENYGIDKNHYFRSNRFFDDVVPRQVNGMEDHRCDTLTSMNNSGLHNHHMNHNKKSDAECALSERRRTSGFDNYSNARSILRKSKFTLGKSSPALLSNLQPHNKSNILKSDIKVDLNRNTETLVTSTTKSTRRQSIPCGSNKKEHFESDDKLFHGIHDRNRSRNLVDFPSCMIDDRMLLKMPECHLISNRSSTDSSSFRQKEMHVSKSQTNSKQNKKLTSKEIKKLPSLAKIPKLFTSAGFIWQSPNSNSSIEQEVMTPGEKHNQERLELATAAFKIMLNKNWSKEYE
jgi:hypothetical protein